ncbi:MAG: PEGA domain-containing protein, partial [Candidatus Hatepunaea meridiana]|nr:PEGA domain-containing protein [Candidatus Hatepunaea meridiana]
MKTLITIIILLCAGSLLATDLREMQLEEVPTITVPDVEFEYQKQGLLIVESPIPGLKFKSTNPLRKGWIYQKDDEPGIWYVKVSAGTNIIDISTDGFLPLLNIRHNFKVREAWKIKVTAKTPEVNELPVKFLVEPSGASLRIDGKTYDLSGNVKLSFGDHDVEITKSGFVTLKERITVDQDHIFFSYTLEKPKLCVVEISTDPSGAEVSIDGMKLNGTTPISDFYNSGRYPIKVTRDKYLTVDETITIDQSKAKNSFTYRLEPNTGTIIIASDPEVNMDIALNGKSVGKTPITLKEQDVGSYEITGSHEYHTSSPVNFTLTRGETYRATLKAEENFAILTVNTTPGASVYLNNQRLDKFKDLRLSPQIARLRAEKPKCKTVESTLILKRGARENVDLYLDEQVGTIAISVDPPTAQIELNGDASEHFTSTGTKIFESIPVGSYELEVSLKGHKNDKRTLRLRPDEMLRERVTLEEGGGGEGPLPGMVFVEIPSGTFMMGSPSNESGRDSDEQQHRVTISGFQMMT